MITEILTIIVPLVSGVLGYLASHLTKSGRVKERAAADKAIKDNYEERIADLHKVIAIQNDNEVKQSGRIAELGAALDNKVDRIREVEDRLVVTERDNTRLAEEVGALKEDLANHRCHILDCSLRQPPNKHTREALAKSQNKN